MPINSGWRDAIDNIIWPSDYGRWDDLGNGSGEHFTITAVDKANDFTFAEDNNGYIRINYTDALRLSNRSEWTIDLSIRINSSSTSTTNYQTTHEGVIFAAGEGGLLTDDGSTRTIDYAGTIDANRKFKFYYHDGSSLNSITSTATIGVDDVISLRVTYSNSEIKVYVDGVLDSTTSASAGIRNTSNNFVIGGNTTGDSTGDYLLGTDITAFQIRKDANTSSTDKQLIDFDPNDVYSDYNNLYENSGWDINTMIKFVDVSPPKPRQLKLIPQTWGDWSYWWINPKSQIEVVTGDISFPTPITGFKNVNIATTDGFLCAYGQGGDFAASQQVGIAPSGYAKWMPIAGTNSIHALDTDLNPITAASDDGPYGSGLITTDSTNYSLTLPSAGYITAEQITESQTMLDSTKVDTYSGNCVNNQGMRPRGIKQISYTIDQQTIEQEVVTTDNSDRRFFMGLPYYEISDSGSTVYEGAGYDYSGSSSLTSRFDHDFRLANSNTVLIQDIDENTSAAAGIIVTTRTAHGLTDGDKVMMRPGQFRNYGSYPNVGTGSTGSCFEFDAFRVHCIRYAKVLSSTEIELYSDPALTNPVNKSLTTDLALHTPGYLITPNSVGEPYIKDLGHKLLTWDTPFADIKDVKSNTDVIYYPAIQRTGIYGFGGFYNNSIGSLGLPTYRQADQTIKEYWAGNSFPTIADTIQTKTTPRGDVSDPIEINNYNTGETGGSLDGAAIFVDLDLPTNGTLHVSVSDVVRADGSDAVQIKAIYGLNGRPPTEGTDDSLSYGELDSANTITIPISADSVMADDDLRSIQLFLALQGVTHTSASDETSATWRIWFVSDVSTDNNRIFWAGGIPPGFVRRSAGTRTTSAITNGAISRPRSNLVYKTTLENSNFTITGIPLIGHSLLGETFVGSGAYDEIFRAVEGTGNSRHYDMTKVDETISKTSGGTTDEGPDIAPWVRFAAQVKDQYRLFGRRRWKCLVSHTSSKEFVTDLQLGRWEQV
jgi:hypothetical protein